MTFYHPSLSKNGEELLLRAYCGRNNGAASWLIISSNHKWKILLLRMIFKVLDVNYAYQSWEDKR